MSPSALSGKGASPDAPKAPGPFVSAAFGLTSPSGNRNNRTVPRARREGPDVGPVRGRRVRRPATRGAVRAPVTGHRPRRAWPHRAADDRRGREQGPAPRGSDLLCLRGGAHEPARQDAEVQARHALGAARRCRTAGARGAARGRRRRQEPVRRPVPRPRPGVLSGRRRPAAAQVVQMILGCSSPTVTRRVYAAAYGLGRSPRSGASRSHLSV